MVAPGPGRVLILFFVVSKLGGAFGRLRGALGDVELRSVLPTARVLSLVVFVGGLVPFVSVMLGKTPPLLTSRVLQGVGGR